MPQMKPMMWTMLMILSLFMIMITTIINFFTIMETNKMNKKVNKYKVIKWKW